MEEPVGADLKGAAWVAWLCGLLPGLVAVGLLVAWSVRPQQALLDFTIEIYALPTLLCWVIGSVLVPVVWMLSRFRWIPRLRAAAAILGIDVLLGIALLVIMGRHISVSEVLVENRSSQRVQRIVVECPGHRFEIGSLEPGESAQRPALPDNEGALTLRARGVSGGSAWRAETFVLECCPSEFRFTLRADGEVVIAERDLR